MVAVLLILTCLQLSACAQTQASEEGEGPAKVEPVAGTDLKRVTLTAQAANRLGIETAPVRDTQVRGKPHKVVPYSAVLYDLKGETWVYVSDVSGTNPEPLTFVRDRVSIDFIDGDLAVLSKGPPSGTMVVTVGGPELYGTESGVGE
jgi:hypothetical protein